MVLILLHNLILNTRTSLKLTALLLLLRQVLRRQIPFHLYHLTRRHASDTYTVLIVVIIIKPTSRRGIKLFRESSGQELGGAWVHRSGVHHEIVGLAIGGRVVTRGGGENWLAVGSHCRGGEVGVIGRLALGRRGSIAVELEVVLSGSGVVGTCKTGGRRVVNWGVLVSRVLWTSSCHDHWRGGGVCHWWGL